MLFRKQALGPPTLSLATHPPVSQDETEKARDKELKEQFKDLVRAAACSLAACQRA